MHISLGFAVYNNHSCPQALPWSQMLIEQWDCKIGNYYVALSLQQYKFVSLFKVWRKIFSMLLGDTVCASPRNSTWFTRLFLLVRGRGLGMRLRIIAQATMHYLLHIAHILYTRVNECIHLFPKPEGNMRLILNMRLVYNEKQKLTTPKTTTPLWFSGVTSLC